MKSHVAPVGGEGASGAESAIRQVTRRFKVRLTPELTQLMRSSPSVARQFRPSAEELLEYGGTDEPFEEGKDNHGIYGLERVYRDRAVVTPFFDCAAYCRYCFKKTRTLAGGGRRMSIEDIEQATAYIASDPRIRIVLITGGDPLVEPGLLAAVLDRVTAIAHVRQIRIGTRNVLFQPDRLDQATAEWLASYQRIDPDRVDSAKSLAVAVSLNHPDEVTPGVVRAVRRLIDRGIMVRGQVTLLKGVNDSAGVIQQLYECFAAVGIAPYYLFHCMPVVGAKHFRTSVQRGLDILESLAHLTGAIAPHYVYVTPAGKVRLGRGSRLDYVTLDGQPFIRAVTPYRAADFLELSGKARLPPRHDVDERGYIVSHYPDGED